MKTFKIIIALAIGMSLLSSCKKAETNNKIVSTSKIAISADAKLATTSFKIDGMTCAIGCAKTIEKELAQTKGVKSATVDFDKKTAKVEYDSNAQSPEELVQIVEKTGDGATYKVSNITNSQDKAMLYQQEIPKKTKGKKKVKVATATNVAAVKEVVEPVKKEVVEVEVPAKKPSCCAAKKHCSADEKKDTM